MRGQKARSGSGTRPGFEGGQTPLYRRLPKLKGIAGGMKAGQQDHVIINLDNLASKFGEGDKVSLKVLQDKGVLNISRREAKLGLKVLGNGDLPFPLTIEAESFSKSAEKKIADAGGTAIVKKARVKWTRKLHEAKKLAKKEERKAQRARVSGRPQTRGSPGKAGKQSQSSKVDQ
jgi:large subunit ribosomal protein L15